MPWKTVYANTTSRIYFLYYAINLFRPETKKNQFQEIRWEIQASQVEIKWRGSKTTSKPFKFLNISMIVSIQSSFFRYGFNLNCLLLVFDPLHLISPWFACISHRISWNGFFFSNTLPYFCKRPRRSFRLNPGIYIRRPKQGPTLQFSSRLQTHEQDWVFINIAHFLLVRNYCAKRLLYWDQQYYCNHAQHF